MDEVKISLFDLLLTVIGLLLFLVDIGLDVLAAVDFYKEEAYVCLGVLLLLLIGSSMLIQIFSWLWYKYDDSELETNVEMRMRPCLKTLHFLQLGVFVRQTGVIEASVKSFRKGNKLTDGAESLKHDLAMLRIFETFSESTPQIVLMFTVILQRGQLDVITVLKTLGSMSAVALGVTSYHRSLRSFLPDKAKFSIISSVMHFLWNLLLLLSRLVALSLFASVQPCYIFAHFISSWLLLFFCVWRVKTDFMDSVFGEWLYRATVGLIWYFDWFSAVEGKTRNKTLLYHSYILVDISVLVGVWYWKMSTDPPHFVVPPLYAAITAASVVAVYILGLFLKMIYYKFFHPNLEIKDLKGDAEIGRRGRRGWSCRICLICCLRKKMKRSMIKYNISMYNTESYEDSEYLELTVKILRGDVPGGDVSGGNARGGNATGGDVSGGDATGGDVSGGDATGGDVSGGDATGGDATGGDATGGDVSGGDATGGDATGGDVTGGDATKRNKRMKKLAENFYS